MHYSDLRIYTLAMGLRDELCQELNQMPYAWRIEEFNQAKRSSSSAAANIVEGFGRRFYVKEFIRFLNFSLGSSDETQNHVLALYNKKHFNKERTDYFLNRYKTLSIQTLNFINYLRKKRDPNGASNEKQIINDKVHD